MAKVSTPTRHVPKYTIPSLRNTDHVPSDLQSFAFKLKKKNATDDACENDGNNAKVVGETKVLSPDAKLKDNNNQMISTN